VIRHQADDSFVNAAQAQKPATVERMESDIDQFRGIPNVIAATLH
jgi:hypothetical protein